MQTHPLEYEINVVIANLKWIKAVKRFIFSGNTLAIAKSSFPAVTMKKPYPNTLTVCNIVLDSVVSDIFGKLSTSIIDYLLKQPGTSTNHEEIASKHSTSKCCLF